MFKFGGSQPAGGASAPGGGFTFGQSNSNAGVGANAGANTGGGGLFGKPAGAAPTGGLFGSGSAAPGNTGSLFGGTSNATTNTNSGGGLFGNTQAPSTNTGGLFGNTQASSGSTGGGLFGSKPQTAAPVGGGLFGNQQNTTTGTGGLFGNQQNTTTGTGGLFGNQQNTTTGTGGLFGNTQQQQQQQQQPQQTSLFGSSTIKSTQPSFAWSQPAQTGQSGLQQQSQQPQLQQQMQQHQQMMFQQQQMQHSNYPQQIQEQIIKCQESWVSSSGSTKLKSFVYNKVNKTDAILYSKPPNVSQENWDKALEQKPSPDVIPIEIAGFDGLYERNQIQRENIAQARVIFNQVLEKFTQLQQKHELDTSARILKAKSRITEIERRILKLGLQLAILKSRGLPLTGIEEKMWNQFQGLLKKSEDPAGLGKTNELWARLAVLKEKAKAVSDHLDNTLVVINETRNNGNVSASNSIGNSNEETGSSINKITQVLSNQQSGIAYLNDVIVKDHVIMDKLLTK